MTNVLRTAIAPVLLMVLSGCIVSDQVTTLVMKPDGSTDVVVVRSNIHFRGDAEQRKEKLETYVQEFENREQRLFDKVKEAGGRIEEARWIRKTAPMANFLRARLPDKEALQQFINVEQGNWKVSSTLEKDGSNRTLTLNVTPPSEKDLSLPPSEAEEVRKKLANNISRTRIAIEQGKVTNANGFIVADDGQSALLNRAQFPERLWEKNEPVKLSITWRHH